MLSPTTRFSNRVDNYVKYRPGYPPEIIDYLIQTIGLKKRFVIADIGSGTGIFSELFLRNGYRVKAVEPNEPMRLAAEKRLTIYNGFTSVDGTAEQTGLKDKSVDLITAAQAFHWFKPLATKNEFMRIIRPGGHIMLVWNIRKIDTPFLEGYQQIKAKYQVDYAQRTHNNDAVIETFFRPMKMIRQDFYNEELLDFESLKGQLLSASYIPLQGQPGYESMLAELEQLFNNTQQNGFVKVEYDTKIYLATAP